MTATQYARVLAAAIEDQLDLRFEATQVPFPVLVIEKVNRVATPNSARDVASLADEDAGDRSCGNKPFECRIPEGGA